MSMPTSPLRQSGNTEPAWAGVSLTLSFSLDEILLEVGTDDSLIQLLHY